MIELRDVVKAYGGRRVVDGVSFVVEPGQVCALIGASGSGKTTLLKMVNRLIAATSGSIRVAGRDIRDERPEMLRRRIGYVVQSFGLFPHWTVEDNIATVPRLLAWPEERVGARVRELLTLLRLDVEEYRGKYPHELSGGQQQRVGVARALAADPELLLMDEPFGALDPVTRAGLRAEFARIHATTGKTILFVTHDMDEALELADVIAVIENGRLVQFGTSREIVERPATEFVRDLIGRAEIGLKRLAVQRVGERMQRGKVDGRGPAIEASSTLREALAHMLAQHTDRLLVRDDSGAVVGSIDLAELVRSP
ncbi:MAG TPA: ABC transporter ATP-binding protein [Alphaproteobacteria bacterium]|nr:ABC transporter ATP-binding protein [Alphaproteobacteria bacterium]